MSAEKVLITDYAWPDLDIERDILTAAGAVLVAAGRSDERSLCDAADGAAAIMTNWARVTRAVISRAAGCRIIARLGIGLDNIDVAFATERGIPVTNVPDYCLAEVAEHALALMLALARNVAFHHCATKRGVYDLGAAPVIRRLEGQTLGIVGLGGIGGKLAEKARGVGLHVIAAGRTKRPVAGVVWRQVDELFAESDFVSLHVPATPENVHFVNDRLLGLMKPTAFLINTARGALVDHAALARALAAGGIAGAALDVQDPEPPDLRSPPYDDPRVVVTPHTAFASRESVEDVRARAAQQVAARLRDEIPENVVNPEVL